ncbi:MAG: class I SAM-dependent methyltransferase [Thermoleophilaceae bacterium]|nr:class I SAM-dependent methyltransferase [Thermoleophilaceae bacterium]
MPRFQVSGELGAEGLIPTTKQFGTALSDIVRCADCGHMQLERFPSEAELEREYAAAASDDYVNEEPGQRLSARAVLERVEHHRSVGRLLDVGCWVGFLMSEAEGRGWDTAGIEPSTFASAHARDVLGLDVRTAGLEDAEGEWDVVVMGDVLEHLTHANAALEKVASLTSPNGLLVLLLPDAGSRIARVLGKRWWSVIPTHVHYFTRDSIATMLGAHGYEVLEFGTDPKAFTVRYYLEKGGGYLPRVSRVLVAIAERLGLADRMWTPDFGDRMLVLARKPVQVVAEE